MSSRFGFNPRDLASHVHMGWTPMRMSSCSPKLVQVGPQTVHAPDNKMDSSFEERLSEEIRHYPHLWIIQRRPNGAELQARNCTDSWLEMKMLSKLEISARRICEDTCLFFVYLLIFTAVGKQCCSALAPPIGMECGPGHMGWGTPDRCGPK